VTVVLGRVAVTSTSKTPSPGGIWSFSKSDFRGRALSYILPRTRRQDREEPGLTASGCLFSEGRWEEMAASGE
jgi:hypothetical protein